MSPQPKKRAAAKPEPEQLPADDLEPDEPDNDDEADEKPDKDRGDQGHGNDPELKIVIRRDVIEVDVPRDGNEVDTFNRVAQLVDEL